MINNVQAAITADRIRLSLERRLLIEPARATYKANIEGSERGESEKKKMAN